MLRSSGIRLFTLAGIEIQIDPSWFFIFILISWSLARGVFPAWHPLWSASFNILLGISAALLFFASVLAHEFAHAIAAKLRNLPVRRITLFLFGGVSNLEREPQSPKTEFLMAVVGPMTSIILGTIFTVFAGALSTPLVGKSAMTTISHSGPIATVAFWLGSVNLLVGVFNLIPGFPLDGGRILRSAIWGITGNLRKATVVASAIGQLIGWLFIFIGISMVLGIVVPFLGTGILNGIWILFIGWFLNHAAAETRVQTLLTEALEDVPVSRLMRSGVRVVPDDTLVDDLVSNWFLSDDERAFPVIDRRQELIGLVCLADLKKIDREKWTNTPVKQIMTPLAELTTIEPEENTAEAHRRLIAKDLRQLPVMHNGHFLGLLRRRDVLRWIYLQSGSVPA